MRKQLLIIVTLFCFVILLVGAQAGFAKPKKTMITAAEDCFNKADDDGDGLTDCADDDCNGATNGACTTNLPDTCSEGTLSCVAGVEQCVPNNQPVPEVCNDGLDNDCDGLTDTEDLEDCGQPQGEICFNDIDDDGDQLIDCADPDCNSAPCDTGLPGICTAGTVTCVDGAAQCVPNNQPIPEVCNDGLDNDCDGLTDTEDLEDCGQPQGEICFNGLDDDGNGFTDCADPACENPQTETCPTGLLGVCAEGTLTCVTGEVQCVPNNQPGDEVCGDGLDNDCNGSVDANDLACAVEGNKVTICHIPRGNPARAHTIKVGLASLNAHLAHGDTIGPCTENSSKRPKKHLNKNTPKNLTPFKGF
jgi:hypothetical protein